MSDESKMIHVDEDTGELVEVSARQAAVAPPISSAEALQQLEDGLELYQRFLSVVAKLTHPNHWVRRGSSYSLRATGAEALANPFGIEWDEPEITREEWSDALGKVVAYEVRGKLRSKLLGREGWFLGYCDTRDQFFLANARAQAVRKREQETGRSRQQFNDEDWRQVDLYTPAFVSPGNVKKKAFSNWIASGVARLIGLRDPSEQLLRDAGLNIEAIPSVDYRSSKGGASKTSGQAKQQASAGGGAYISEKQRKLLWSRLYGRYETKEEAFAMADKLKKKYGVDSLNQLPASEFDAILQLVQDGDVPF